MAELLSRDSFYVEEIDIFKAVRAWKEGNPDSDDSGKRDFVLQIEYN